MTQCKIEFAYASHCISKNLTPGRMLKKDLLIAKMIDVPYVSVARRITITPGQHVKTKEKLMC